MPFMMNVLSFLFLVIVAVGTAYLYLLALASMRSPAAPVLLDTPANCFAVMIPAHDEETVIARTVRVLRALEYPDAMYDIFVIADHCKDRTAEVARQCGAICFEREEKPAGSKGAALAWGFRQVFALEKSYDAFVIFDADTQVPPFFLRVMNSYLVEGAGVIQGQHVISNPQDGWFPALVWAMFMIDNRFQNLGRSNLGWSAKLMGDSVCFRAEIISELGWGEGLTEDYGFRQQLLLNGLRIEYAPKAIGYGEAPPTWESARLQRLRWLKGTVDSSRRNVKLLLKRGLVERNMALLDGAVQALLPSYSTLAFIALIAVTVQWALPGGFSFALRLGWLTILLSLFAYPFLGLFLERAPRKAYLALGLGPLYVLWRTWLAVTARFLRRPVKWIRTEHGAAASAQDPGEPGKT
jgi:cellulose synthase/poly-beta-1,6-N-acetylglucosamine synthase-like glycosyltransferase